MFFKIFSVFLMMIVMTTSLTSFVDAASNSENEIKVVQLGNNELHIPSHLIMNDSAGLVDTIGKYFGMSGKPLTYLEVQFNGDELLRVLSGLNANVKEDSFLSLGVQAVTGDVEIAHNNSTSSSWLAEIWGDQSLIVTKVDGKQLFEVRLSSESIGWSLLTADPKKDKFSSDDYSSVYIGSCTRKSDSGTCTGSFIVNGLQVRFTFPSYLGTFSLDIKDVLIEEISSWKAK